MVRCPYLVLSLNLTIFKYVFCILLIIMWVVLNDLNKANQLTGMI